MINFDYITKENIKEHNLILLWIPDHPYRLLVIRESGSRKTNSFFNLITHQSDTGRIYLCAKNPYEGKYQLLINKKESARLNGCKAFIEYSNNLDNIYKNIEEYNSNKEHKIYIVFDNVIPDVLSY